jgi:hypothetical protein
VRWGLKPLLFPAYEHIAFIPQAFFHKAFEYRIGLSGAKRLAGSPGGCTSGRSGRCTETRFAFYAYSSDIE